MYLHKIWMYFLVLFIPPVTLCYKLSRHRRQDATENPSKIDEIRMFLEPGKAVDLILMIDSSKGMGKSSFYTQELPLLEAIVKQYAVLHPEQVRLAAITFAIRTDIDFDYISGSSGEPINKCELFYGKENSIWNQIQYFDDAADNQRTELLQPLTNAGAIFETGRSKRPGVTQVLVIATDADIQTTEYTATVAKADELNDNDGVKIFVIGSGTWVKPGNGGAIASSTDYFDFKQKWIELLFETEPYTTYGPDDPQLFQDFPMTISYCGKCRENSACYCDPYSGNAVCKCNKGHSYEHSGQSELCSPCALHEYKGGIGNYPCTNCPPPSYTDTTGTTDVSLCLCPDTFVCTAECGPNPCGINSLCLHNSIVDLVCSCLDGWEDAYSNPNPEPRNISCTVHVKNECDNNNCRNGATCVDLDGDYACNCPFGYEGDLCEIEKDMCTIDFCQNEGTCTSRANGFSCDCAYGFKGTYCQDIGDTTTTTAITTTTTTTQPPPSTEQQTLKTTTQTTCCQDIGDTATASTTTTISTEPQSEQTTTKTTENSAVTSGPSISTTNDVKQTMSSRPENEVSSKSSSTGITIGSVLAAAILIGCIIAIFIVCNKRKKKSAQKDTLTTPPSTLDIVEYHPDNSQIGYEALNPRDQNQVANYEVVRMIGAVTFTDSDLTLHDIIYQGRYTIIKSGTLSSTDGPTAVAVKALQAHTSLQRAQHLFNQITCMTNIGPHNNIAEIYKIDISGPTALKMVMHYYRNGNLRNYLRGQRPTNANIDLDKLLNMCVGIARGLTYLEQQQHEILCYQLSGGHILVDDLECCRVTGFGEKEHILQREMEEEQMGTPGAVQLKAPEVLENPEAHTKLGDIWAFGILMHEIYNMGEVPYNGMDNEAIATYVKAGKILSKPDACLTQVYSIMTRCWAYHPQERPAFSVLLELLMEQLENNQYCEVIPDSHYESVQ